MQPSDSMIISQDAVDLTSRKPVERVSTQMLQQLFTPSKPLKGVLPKGKRVMAMDQIPGWSGWNALGSMGGFGWGVMGANEMLFLGYPALSAMSQKAEYRNVTETTAEEMTRKWGEIKSKSELPDKMDKCKMLTEEFERLQVRETFKRLDELDGFFGRGHLHIDLGDDDETEIASDIGNGHNATSRGKCSKGSLKRLGIVEPIWCYPALYNANEPLKGTWYNPDHWYVMGRTIHKSRLIPYVSREVPDLFKPAYQFGGLSLTQMVRPMVEKWYVSNGATSQLVGNFATKVLKTNLGTVLKGGSADALVKRVQVFNQLQSNGGTLALDFNNEDFGVVSVPLGGLDRLRAQDQEHISTSSKIPLVKWTGIAPSGLNASSEGEIQVWYDYIHARQEWNMTRKVRTVLGFAQLNLFGEIDPDIFFEFDPLEEESELERAQRGTVEMQTHQGYVELGVISAAEVREIVVNDPESPYTGMDPARMPSQPGIPGMEGEEGQHPQDDDPTVKLLTEAFGQPAENDPLLDAAELLTGPGTTASGTNVWADMVTMLLGDRPV